MVDAFEASPSRTRHPPFGRQGRLRRGRLVGSAEGKALSTASAFSGKPVPVIARFSIGGGNPKAPDNAKTTRGLALAFELPGGEGWQMANISAPVFAAGTPEQLLALLESRTPDAATKQADPAKVKAFNDANPDVLLQGKHLASQPVPASYAKVNYWGVNAFAFVDAKGGKQYAQVGVRAGRRHAGAERRRGQGQGPASGSTSCASASPPARWRSTSTCSSRSRATGSTARWCRCRRTAAR